MDPEQTAALWLAEEEAVRAQPARTGISRAEDVEGRSGLEMLAAMIAGELPRAPMAETLDFLLLRVERGFAIFQGRPQARHYNPLGTVHGGWFATLLDSAMGCAVQSTLPVGKAYTTIEFRVNLLRPLNAGVPVVRAEGKLLHAGRQVATSEARLVGPDGKLYAHGTTTCLIFDR